MFLASEHQDLNDLSDNGDGDKRHPNPKHDLPVASYFNTRRPARLAHYDVIYCPDPIPMPGRLRSPGREQWKILVSSKWKSEVESVEPNVHEFFQHTLHFKDEVMPDFYVFRMGNLMSDCIIPYAQPQTDLLDPSKITWTKGNGEVNAQRLHGLHWILHDTLWPIISNALAQRLKLLLPRDVYLIPLRSCDSGHIT